jgi:hypothetical protein
VNIFSICSALAELNVNEVYTEPYDNAFSSRDTIAGKD